MKNHLTATLLAVLPLVTVATGQAQTGQGQEPPPPPKPRTVIAPALVPPEKGRLEGGVYSNDFFGISFSTPKDWVSQEMAERQAIIDSGKKIIDDGKLSAKDKAGVEASVQRTVFLLSVSKYDLNAPPPGAFNAQLSFLAERVPTALVKTGEDYITLMMRVARHSSVQLELTGAIRKEEVGGVAFAAADAKMAIGIGGVSQKYLATVRDGYALLFAFSYADEPDARAFEEIIKSVRFK